MSQNIWTQCEANSRIRPLSFKGWRCVEDQSRSSTLNLVDSIEEHDLLESLLDVAKPKVPDDCNGLHYLLFTPFRYPPLKWGSRFGTRAQRSLFYGALEEQTSLAETAFYQLSFWRASEAKMKPQTKHFSTFTMRVKAQIGLDLTEIHFNEYAKLISHPTNYEISQSLGEKMRDEGVEVFLFWSARCKEGRNFALFSPLAFAEKKPSNPNLWESSLSKDRAIFRNKASKESYTFPASSFLFEGSWPDII